MRARADLRWLDVTYLLLNIESQIKWFPLLTAGMLAELSREFWCGYAGDRGLPDGLSPEQLVAILYVLRLRYLLGGAARPAYFRIMDGPLDHRALRSLKQSVRERARRAVRSLEKRAVEFGGSAAALAAVAPMAAVIAMIIGIAGLIAA